MSKLVLLIVGAMWMAVLLPPLLRSRFDPGASSSVSDFRRQLNTLQRTQAPVGAPHAMRAMARPLAPAPRQMSPRQPMAQPTRAMARPIQRQTPQGPARGHERPHLVAVDQPFEHDLAAPRARRSHHGAHSNAHPRHHLGAESNFMPAREVTRRRRVNVLYGLVAANALTLFLGLTTGSTAMVYLFTVAFLGLGAYCYVLVQLRNQEYLRRYYGQRRAA